MHVPGHVGAALLAYAPVAALLSAAGEPTLAALGVAAAIGVCTLPDVDHDLPMEHRGVTHTVWFAGCCGAVGALAGLALAGPLVDNTVAAVPASASIAAAGEPVTVAAVLGTATLLSIGSHLLADSITPMGIAPFEPLSAWHHSFDIVLARNPRANAALFVAGTVVFCGSQAVLLL